jgi:hypothetical protein
MWSKGYVERTLVSAAFDLIGLHSRCERGPAPLFGIKC